MSRWTHISGVIRFDNYSSLMDFESEEKIDEVKILKEVLGPISTFANPGETCTLPLGSEGSLEYKIDKIPDDSLIPNLNVLFYGDLRDYGGKKDIKIFQKWLKTLVKELPNYLSVRNAVFELDDSYHDYRLIFSWADESKKFVKAKIKKTH